jgi:hypothetical protein
LAAISDFAVQLRYDFSIWPSQEEAQDAVGAAEQVRSTIAAHLALDSE